MDLNAKDTAVLRQILELQTSEDNRLDENQKGVMRWMIEQGMDEREAKIRVLCIGKTPDHMQAVPPSHDSYPRAVYNADGRIKSAMNEEDYKKAKKAGWEDKPSDIHVETLLALDIKRNTLPPGAVAFPPRNN